MSDLLLFMLWRRVFSNCCNNYFVKSCKTELSSDFNLPCYVQIGERALWENMMQ